MSDAIISRLKKYEIKVEKKNPEEYCVLNLFDHQHFCRQKQVRLKKNFDLEFLRDTNHLKHSAGCQKSSDRGSHM